jgi:hypothetical protein
VETAWLIERTGIPLCYAKDGCLQWVTFTDPNAWRFDDKASAQNVIAARGLKDVFASEHGWVSPKRQDASGTKGEP